MHIYLTLAANICPKSINVRKVKFVFQILYLETGLTTGLPNNGMTIVNTVYVTRVQRGGRGGETLVSAPLPSLSGARQAGYITIIP